MIVSFDGRPVKQARDLPLIVAESPIDTDLKAVVMRDGKETTVTVRLKQMAKDAEDDTETAPEALDDGGSSDEAKPQKPEKRASPKSIRMTTRLSQPTACSRHGAEGAGRR